jgi:hypothetical protein
MSDFAVVLGYERGSHYFVRDTEAPERGDG